MSCMSFMSWMSWMSCMYVCICLVSDYLYNFVEIYLSMHRQPILAGSTVILKARMKNTEGRKLYMQATMENVDGQSLAESQSLFIVLRKGLSSN